ncbi:MAG: hypothetical protein ABIG44_13055 [Planctomycetota bacterium]
MKPRHKSWLRLFIWLLAGVVVLLAGCYAYLTRPARLRTQFLEALAGLPAEQLEVGQVSFSLTSGLEVRNLAVTPPADDVPANLARDFGFRIDRARIRCDLLALLWGQVRPREVVLSGIKVNLAASRFGSLLDTEAPSAGVQRASWPELPTDLLEALPSLRIEGLDLQLYDTEQDGGRLIRRVLAQGVGRPTARGYELRIEPLGRDQPPLAEFNWERLGGELNIVLDAVDFQALAPLVPERWLAGWREIEPRGRVRLERVVIQTPWCSPLAEQPAELCVQALNIRLSSLRAAIPIEEIPVENQTSSQPIPAARRFLQLSDGEVALVYQRQADGMTLRAGGTGQLNSAPIEFELAARPARLGEARVEDLVAARFSARGLTFPTLEEQPEFVRSPRLPRGVRKFFREYQPRGVVDLRLSLRRSAQENAAMSIGNLVLEGEVEARGAACRYYRFPYDFRDVRGRLQITPGGLIFDGMRARHGSTYARIYGVVNQSCRATGFDLTVHGRNIPLDADLYAALPTDYRHLWEQTMPLGVCDVNVRLRRADGAPDAEVMPPTATHIDARLIRGSLEVEPGRRLRVSEGMFSIANGIIEIHELHGSLNGTATRLRGTIGVKDNDSQTDLYVEAADMWIERSARLAAGSDNRESELHFAGRGDVWGHLRGTNVRDDRDAHYVVHVKDGVLSGFDPITPWEDCAGWINVVGEQQEALQFTARQDVARLQARGALPAATRNKQPVNLEISVAEADLAELIRQAVPPRWLESVDALGFRGPGTVTVRLYPTSSEESTAKQVAEVSLRAERMTPVALPVELREVEAQVTLTTEGIEVHRAQGRQGIDGAVQGSGRVEWRGDAPSAEFDLSAHRLEITPELVDAMPADFGKLLRRLAPEGQIHVELDRARVAGADQRRWQFSGRLILESAALFLGLPLTALDGELWGDCVIDARGETEVSAEFFIREGLLDGRLIQEWGGRLERSAGDRWVRLEDLRGRLCGGDALGFVKLDPDSSAYELSLTLQNVSFGQLLPPQDPKRDTPRRGLVTGHIFLRGTAGEAATRSGGGDVCIRGGSLLQTPVLAHVVEVSQQKSGAINDALDLAELRFVWQGSLLRFTRVDIQSRDLRMVGDGTWDMASDALDLTLVGAHPDHWPRVAVLSDLLEIAGQELVHYRVQGTTATPRVTVEPLHKLNATLRALLLDSD